MLASTLAAQAIEVASAIDETAHADLVARCLIDAAAAGVAGSQTNVAGVARRYAQAAFGPGSSPYWFGGGDGSTALGAAFVNSTAMSALDVDDGNRSARGHLGAAVIPVATAVGAAKGATAREFGAAVLAGCEIGARLGAAERRAFSASGRWAGVGAAVSAGLLLGFNRQQLENAIAIAVHAAPLMAPAATRVQMTGHVKEGVPFGVLSGMSAALLAQEGYTGDADAIESAEIYDVGALQRQGDALVFGRTYFKIYSCCRLAHAPIDAALSIVTGHGLAADDIRQLTVETFRTAIELPNETTPSSFESAQYSLPFTIAVALELGPDKLLPMRWDSAEDERVRQLARRIVLRHVPDMDPRYPGMTPARVTIETHDGRVFTLDRETADGDPSRPFDKQRLLGKLHVLAAGNVAPSYADLMVARLSIGLPDAKSYERLLSPLQGTGALP
jgi:2-methylcitrate dehydratase PrpD